MCFFFFILRVNTFLLIRISIIQSHQQPCPWPTDVFQRVCDELQLSLGRSIPFELIVLMCSPEPWCVQPCVSLVDVCLLHWLEVNWMEQAWPVGYQFYMRTQKSYAFGYTCWLAVFIYMCITCINVLLYVAQRVVWTIDERDWDWSKLSCAVL